MKVTRRLNDNQTYAECPIHGETLWQRITDSGLDYWFCHLDFQRAHTIDHAFLFPPIVKPRLALVPSTQILPLSPEPVIETRLGFKEREVPPEPASWTVPKGDRRACRVCGKYSHHKPELRCSEFRHQIAYQRSLAAKRKVPAHRSTPKCNVMKGGFRESA